MILDPSKELHEAQTLLRPPTSFMVFPKFPASTRATERRQFNRVAGVPTLFATGGTALCISNWKF